MSDPIIDTDPREAFSEEVKDAYNQVLLTGPNEVYDNPEIIYKVPRHLADRMRRYGCVPGTGCTTCWYPQLLGRVLYLDVGRWGGSAPNAEPTNEHWGRARYFGLVCGQVAALCNYPTPGASGQPDLIAIKDDFVKQHEDFKRIVPLLHHLSSSATLGPVVVEAALCADMPTELSQKSPPVGAAIPTQKEIQVLLGDLHLPVMDTHEPSRTNFGSALDPPRKGRLNPLILGKVELLGWGIVPLILANPLGAPVGIAGLIGTAKAALADERVDAWPDDVPFVKGGAWVTNAKPATEWLVRYTGERGIRNEYAPEARVRGADVFDGAGGDLERWLDLLIGYQAGADVDAERPPIRLTQLGDCYDFWVGMRRLSESAEGPAPRGDLAGVPIDVGKGFLGLWINETHNTLAGPAAKKLRDLANHGVPTRFLRGNHDNYMFLLDWPAIATPTGLVLEHGHATDDFNSDENYTDGWAITQAAYMVPDVRFIEDPLVFVKNSFTGSLAARLRMIDRAVDLCITNRLVGAPGPKSKTALTYVQGHTHHPLLRLVSLVEDAPHSGKTPTFPPVPKM